MHHVEIVTLPLTITGEELDFATAKRAARALIADEVHDPVLIAWYDGKKNELHPKVPECQDKPCWLAYAEEHGGQLRIDVNEGEYSFIFAGSA